RSDRVRCRQASSRDRRDADVVAPVCAGPAVAAAPAGHRPDRVVPAPVGGEMTDTAPTASQQAAEDAVARERARISRELHDGLATELAGAISLFKVYLENHRGERDQVL